MSRKERPSLKNYRNDVVRATAFIDTDTEYHLLEMYSRSVDEEMERPKVGVDIETREFFLPSMGRNRAEYERD